MNENLSKAIKQAYSYPKYGLSDDIWRAILLKQSQELKKKQLLYSSLGILSSLGSILIAIIAVKQFSSSGFFQYASLVFSGGSFGLYWKEYLLSLVDALPVASLGAFSFLLFSMLVSIRKFIFYYKNQLLKI